MTALAKYEAASAALEAAVSADEIMAVELTAAALEKVARVAKDWRMEANALTLRTRARLKLGQALDRAEEAGVFGRGKRLKDSNCTDAEQLTRVKLAEAGIDRKLSAEARRLSGIGAQAVDAMLRRVQEESEKRGAVARDVLQTKLREDRHQARVRLQQELSDKSAELEGGRKFPVIYADPATRFLSGFGPKSIENHYPTMTMDELCDLPVAARAMPACQLFVWTTVPQLANTITRILPSWGGFKYSSHCMWDKTDEDHDDEIGAGLVFRNQHEVLIYATRGNPPGPSWRPKSIYRERKREHSRKPDYYREMIRRMTGGLPVLELFARVDAEHPLPIGFYAWGNQAEVIDYSTGEIHENTGAAMTAQEPAQSPISRETESDDDRLELPAFLKRRDDNSFPDVASPRSPQMVNAGEGSG